MTQAFNLAQLANNLNTSGQLDATDGLTGLVANANLASSGTASASTFLRGDRTWQPVVQKVLNVVQRTTATATTNNSTSWANSDVYATITPTSASSQILVLANTTATIATIDVISMGLRLMRGSTPVVVSDPYINYNVDAAMYNRQAVVMMYLDAPASTSAQTYTLSFRRASFSGPYGGECSLNTSGFGSMTLLEISA